MIDSSKAATSAAAVIASGKASGAKPKPPASNRRFRAGSASSPQPLRLARPRLQPRPLCIADLAIPLAPGSTWRPSPRSPPVPPSYTDPLQHAPDSREGLFERRIVMDDRQTNIFLAGIDPAIRRPRRVAAGQHANRRLPPQPKRRLFAVADIEPQKEPAIRPVETIAAAEHRFGDIEFAAVEGAVLLDMGLIGPQCGRRCLDRQRHLTAAIAAQMREVTDQPRIAGDKARAQPGGARPLRQGVEDRDIVEKAVHPGTEGGAGLERAGRRRTIVDLGVALVDREHKIVL